MAVGEMSELTWRSRTSELQTPIRPCSGLMSELQTPIRPCSGLRAKAELLSELKELNVNFQDLGSRIFFGGFGSS